MPGSELEAEGEMETYPTLTFFVEGSGWGRGPGPNMLGTQQHGLIEDKATGGWRGRRGNRRPELTCRKQTWLMGRFLGRKRSTVQGQAPQRPDAL